MNTFPADPGGPGDANVLLVEDNSGDVFLVRQALAEHGFRGKLAVAWDGEEAIQLIDSLDADPAAALPALVVLDLNLPKRNGHEVLSHLRASKRLSRVKVLICSSSQTQQDRGSAAQLGADRYFQKPPDLDAFLAVGGVINSMLA